MLFEEPQNIQIEINGCNLQVKEHTIKDTQVFHIVFDDGRKALTITKADTKDGTMWMSIPQGRQKEALQIGKKITEYFKER